MSLDNTNEKLSLDITPETHLQANLRFSALG